MPEVTDRAHLLQAPDGRLDEATRILLEQAADEAYARGCRDGAAQAAQAVAMAATQVTAAVQGISAELRDMAAQVDIELALRIAGAVLDREPADDTIALLAKVQAALAALDDDPLTVHVSADAAAPLAEALAASGAAGGSTARVVADASLAPGDARVSGRWSRADLTRRGAWDAVAAIVGGQQA